jgi:RNA recognition motif-containing protein
MSKRLFVGNVSHAVTEAELRDVFGASGEVKEVKVLLDPETGRPRGFAFVEMKTEDEAEQAVEALDGSVLQGRALTVRQAQTRPGPRGGGAGRGM